MRRLFVLTLTLILIEPLFGLRSFRAIANQNVADFSAGQFQELVFAGAGNELIANNQDSFIVAAFDDDWDDDDWDDDWDDDNGFYGDEDWIDDDEDDWGEPVRNTAVQKQQPSTTSTKSPILEASSTKAPASTASQKKDSADLIKPTTSYSQKLNTEDGKELEDLIAKDQMIQNAKDQERFDSLAKTFKRSKEDLIKLYSQYGDLLSGLDPKNPKDLKEIEKLIEIVGVPKRERTKMAPTLKEAPKDDPIVNFSARNIPARDAFATLARVSGKSITVSGQIADRDTISVVEINDQPFTKAFLSLVEAADVDFSAAGDNYTIIKKKQARSTSLSAGMANTDIDLSLPLEDRYADLVYDNEDLSSIIKDLSNKYGVDIVLTATPTERVTMKVRGVNVEDAFELVFSGSQFGYTRKEDTFVVYSSANKNFSLDKKTVLFPLKYLEAMEAQKLLPAELKNLVQVSENQNAFIAEGSKAELTQLYEFVRTIDRPIPQVELNLKLVEVNKDFLRNNNIFQEKFSIGRVGKVTDGFLGGLDSNFSTDQWGVFTNRPSYQQNSSDSQIKVNQRLLVTSGKSAKINFDEDINVVLNAADPAGQTIGVVQNQRIQRITAGNSLDITPVVGGGGVVTVKVDVEVSVNGPINSQGVPANTVRRRLSSEIQIINHETIAIGGLFDDRKGAATTNEIPILSKLPVIGNLFSNGTKNKNLKELIILITPHIRSGDDEDEQVFIQAQGN
jgi:hypothetical protein